MKKIIILIILLSLFGCKSYKGYVFEVYKNGDKVKEVCLCAKKSFIDKGTEYRFMNQLCEFSLKCVNWD
jgi:hypothetical protein